MARQLPDFQCQSAGLSCLDCGTIVMCVGDETLTAYKISCAENQVSHAALHVTYDISCIAENLC